MNALRVSFRELAYDIAHARIVQGKQESVQWIAIINYFVEKRCIADYRGQWLFHLLLNDIVRGERAIDGTHYAYIKVRGVICAHYEVEKDKLIVEYNGVEPFYRDVDHEKTK